MADAGALSRLRVLDWTDESGRLAGKLLAEAGADVLRVRPGARPRSGDARDRVDTLAVWLDGGTRRAVLEGEGAAAASGFAELAARADLVIASGTAEEVAALRAGTGARPRNPALVRVWLTPYGLAGPRAGYRASDLVAAALGGVLAVSGTEDSIQNGWGRQTFNVGGLYAAVAGLAAVHGARATGRGADVDLSLVQAVASCTEQVLMYWFNQSWFPGGIAPRQGSLHWTGLYEVMRCRSGDLMLAVAPNLRGFFDWMIADGAAGPLAESPPASAAEAFQRSREIMAQARLWAAANDAAAFAAEAQTRSLAWGEVRDVAAAARCEQLAARGFLRDVRTSGGSLTVPHPLFRLTATPGPPASSPPSRAETFGEALAAWPMRGDGARVHAVPGAPVGGDERRHAVAPSHPARGATKPLAGLRVLDFTWVLAGPFATRILADLGADVVKIQTERLSQGANANEFPFFLMWNRGKRSLALDMGHARAVPTFRRLVERSDVVIDNFSPGVLDRWGIGWDSARAWNPGAIYLSMAGCGGDGPWRDRVTYAPTIHALCGLTDLTNPPGRRDVGLGVSLTDHVSGLAGALAILEALEARRRTGAGQRIDLSQLEIGAYLVGPAYIDELAGRPTPRAAGNRDPFDDFVPNEAYRCRDGGWIAITARDDAEWHRLCRAIGDAALADDRSLATAEGRRRARADVDRRLAEWSAGQDAEAAMRLLQANGVPAGQVQTARELTERDEQLACRRWTVELPHASIERQSMDVFPATFDGERVTPDRASPAFGEHTFEVCAELLGLDEATIAEGIADGLFA
ncbi:MAG TPA: CoA transferase [Candidatus Binatia bacterium]|nr:CoA transferase [Candidatus Binatia bacterium]